MLAVTDTQATRSLAGRMINRSGAGCLLDAVVAQTSDSRYELSVLFASSGVAEFECRCTLSPKH